MTGKDRLLHDALAAYSKADYNGIALMPTGSGKGRVMVESAKILNPKRILYLCNSVGLRDKMFKDELHKWDAAYLISRIDFECYQTAWKWVGKEYDLLLADEFDASLTPKYKKVYTNNQFTNRILVSATLDDSKRKMAEKIAPIIFERTPADIIDAKVVNGVRFFFINYNLTSAENAIYLSYNLQFKKLLTTVRTKEIEAKLNWIKIQRKQFLSKLESSLEVARWLLKSVRKAKPNEKILIFCGLSEQADKVCKYSYHSGNDTNGYLDAFDAGKITELAVVDKVNRGLNINQIRHIIAESTGSSKTRITQRLGRGQRLDVDELLSVYFLVPYYKSAWGELKPTIVLQWILDSTKDMNLKNCKTIKYVKTNA